MGLGGAQQPHQPSLHPATALGPRRRTCTDGTVSPAAPPVPLHCLQDVVELEAACARASSWLWLTPYAGQRYASAVGVFVSSGWASAEVGWLPGFFLLLGSARADVAEPLASDVCLSPPLPCAHCPAQSLPPHLCHPPSSACSWLCGMPRLTRGC